VTGRTVAYRWVAAVGAGLVIIAVVLGLALVRPWAGDGGLAAPPSPTPEPEPVAVLSAAGDAPAPTADGVRAAIDDLVREAGEAGRVSAAVVDATTGESLYRHDPDTQAIPASTVKLATAATVLATLGPAHQLATTAVAGEEPGEVVLVGGGDPTLAIDEAGFYPDAARLDLLAEQVRTALSATEITKVMVDSTLFTGPVHGPWDEDIPGGGYVGPITALMTDGGRMDPDPKQAHRAADRWDQPDLAAGREFAELLGLDGDDVTRGEAPPTGRELGRVVSPPIQRLVEIMLASSDNVVAEALARQVALARGEPASFEGAAVAMAETLEKELGLGEAELADGSGLSRDNLVTATLLTDLLAMAVGSGSAQARAAGSAETQLAGVVTGLAVAGWSGTLADRYDDPELTPAAGAVRAKTGTLAGVHALAGLVVTADGGLLAFALLANDASDGIRKQLDRIVATLASCGCP
jgi:D-alanyl-D-alanine carboxypeptidase/D-alanyl-D-alanine-endopeptidase (penicillin-binding protein 4)